MPLNSEGLQEPQTWQVLLGSFVIATAVQFFKLYGDRDNLLPLRVLLGQSMLAGLAALIFALLMIDRITVGWGFVFAVAGVVGWLGGDALGLLAAIGKRQLDRHFGRSLKDPKTGPHE